MISWELVFARLTDIELLTCRKEERKVSLLYSQGRRKQRPELKDLAR